jgi:hypothetical protein
MKTRLLTTGCTWGQRGGAEAGDEDTRRRKDKRRQPAREGGRPEDGVATEPATCIHDTRRRKDKRRPAREGGRPEDGVATEPATCIHDTRRRKDKRRPAREGGRPEDGVATEPATCIRDAHSHARTGYAYSRRVQPRSDRDLTTSQSHHR